MRGATAVKTTAVVAALLAMTTACTHTYLFGSERAPEFERGDLVVPKRAGDERVSVRNIVVSTTEFPFSFRSPTPDERQLLREGVVPETIHTVRVEVDNAAAVWRDWGLAGFGIGASIVMAALGMTAVIEPNDARAGVSLPMAILFASAVGAEFMLIGVGLGVGLEDSATDMRYRTYAD